MKLRKTLAGILGAVVMLLGVGTFEHVNRETGVHAAETATFNFSTLTSNTNGKELTTYTVGQITFVPNKGTNGNPPKYYKSGSAGRFYGGNYFNLKATEGYSITGVTLTFGSSDGSNSISVDCGTLSNANWTGNANNVKFTIGGSSGNRRIQQIEVSYEGAKDLEPLNAPEIKCVDDQTGTYTWNVVEGAVGYSYTINDETRETETPINVVLKDGETLKVFAKGDNETTGDGPVSETTYVAPYNIKVKDLVSNYYFEGSYIRETKINLNEAAQNELVECFHAEVNMLERTTYFTPNALWMTNEEGTYSYYGTSDDEQHLTGGRVQNLGDISTSIVEKNTGGMEGKYVTLTDIIVHAASATWAFNDGVYTSSDETIISDFLAFTAPCFLGLNENNAHYFTITGVSVKENNGVLELKLLTSGDNGKFVEGANNVLSIASISKYVEKNNNNLDKPTTITFDNTSKRTSFNASMQVWEENGVVVTNNKASSQNDVADYAKPARFYKDSELIIESANGLFNKITIKVNSDSKYATAIVNSINGTVEGATSSNDSTTVTIIFETPTSELEFNLSGGQARVDFITLEYVA